MRGLRQGKNIFALTFCLTFSNYLPTLSSTSWDSTQSNVPIMFKMVVYKAFFSVGFLLRFKVGGGNRGVMEFSHLLFTNDTKKIFQCKSRTARITLMPPRLFWSSFKLKKKLGNQCQWVKEESNKIELASVVGRKVGNFKQPFSSLKIEQFGMPLLMGRLAGWKKLYLSKGGKGHSQQKYVIFPS